MPPRSRRFFIVGVFVTVSFILLAGVIIWIGASKYFQEGKMYVTFFQESVQGLNKDSEVKYLGVKVGLVEDISIAPDNKTVAVYMIINLKDDLSDRVVAQLTMTGITGLVFVNLEPRKPGEPDKSPKIEFATEYPVIPSKPSDISQIISGIQMAVEQIKKADIEGTVKEFKNAAAAVKDVARSKELQSLLAKADASAGYLRDSLKKINLSIEKGKLDEALVAAREAFEQVGSLVEGLGTEVGESKIPQTIKKVRKTVEDAQDLMQNLKRTSVTLERLVERLYYRPSDVIFGKAPKPRFNEKRERTKRW
jgi:phospholipid/cholesterol/gamma-HCH transport system substrate-binding protein